MQMFFKNLYSEFYNKDSAGKVHTLNWNRIYVSYLKDDPAKCKLFTEYFFSIYPRHTELTKYLDEVVKPLDLEAIEKPEDRRKFRTSGNFYQ